MKKDDPEKQKTEKADDKPLKDISSESIDNAHASGDGSIRRSEKSLEETGEDDKQSEQPSVPY